MQGNQGLEALAALCGGQIDAPTEGRLTKGNGAAGAGSSSSLRGPSVIGAQQAQAVQHALLAAARSNTQVTQQFPVQNLTPQQWQQAVAATVAQQGGGSNPALAAQNFLLTAGLVPQQQQQQQQQHNVSNNTGMQAIQQLVYFQMLQQAQAKLAPQHPAPTMNGGGNGGIAFTDQAQQAILMALAAGKAQQRPQTNGGKEAPEQSHLGLQVIPPASPPVAQATPSASVACVSSPATKIMKPPPPPSAYSLPSTLSTAGILKQTTASPHATIAPMPGAAGGKIMPAAEGAVGGAVTSMPTGNKKQHKRAANRRSAQLSRKRKKLFIEELKEENDELRRKEQILRSIPDLIVVFDSSGKLWFVSQSVSRFLDMIPEELEGTSFWDRLCEDSVRLLKAAFMDALAARKSDSESAPLGSGVWELRLVDKDGGYKVVTLNGVVHFSGDSPECVCCIRPRDQQSVIPLQKKAKGASHRIRAVSSSDGSRSSVENAREHPQIRIKPHQSVINAETPDEARMASRKQAAPNDEGSADAIGRQAVRISDGDSGSIVSESGSDEGVVSN